MKLRIKGNFIRYRLSKSEVELFTKVGYIEESVEFISGKLTYALQVKKDIEKITVEYINNKMTIFFPEGEKDIWNTSELVGYKNTLELPQGGELNLLLEKDFVCLDEVEEDQSDNFPNPKLNC